MDEAERPAGAPWALRRNRELLAQMAGRTERKVARLRELLALSDGPDDAHAQQRARLRRELEAAEALGKALRAEIRRMDAALAPLGEAHWDAAAE